MGGLQFGQDVGGQALGGAGGGCDATEVVEDAGGGVDGDDGVAVAADPNGPGVVNVGEFVLNAVVAYVDLGVAVGGQLECGFAVDA